MSDFETPTPTPPPKSLQVSVLHFWLAIAATFAVGIGVGFILRPQTTAEPVVEVVTTEVVVTATSNPQAIAQADITSEAETSAQSTASQLPPATATLQRQSGVIGPPPPPSTDGATEATSTEAEPPAQSEPAANPQQAGMMDFLLADARHFQGDPEAPITIVEFSDFK